MRSRRPAHLATVNRDGSPQITLAWVGLDGYLVVDGLARVTEGGAPELLQELARTYLGPDVRFPPMPDPPPGFVTRITPERIGGVGPWAPGPG